MAIAELFPDPSSYVIQFRPGANDTLWVSFDGEAIERGYRFYSYGDAMLVERRED